MKIIQTPGRFYPHTGGVETYVHDLSKRLSELGHTSKVVCPNHPSEEHIDDFPGGITTRRLTSVGQIAYTELTPMLPVALLQEVKNADILHTHLPTPWSADISTLVGELTNTPTVITYHNDIIGDGIADYISQAYNSTVLRATLRSADQIIITQENYIESSKQLSQYKDKITVVGNGVDIERFQPQSLSQESQRSHGINPDTPTIFFLSVLNRSHDYKGLDVLLQAIKLLNEHDGRSVQLIVGGDGEARSKYEKIAAKLGIENSVNFKGYIPDEELPAIYSSSDVFALPSLSSDQEGFGLVLLEALACGTPVVTTDVVGVADDVRAANLGEVVNRHDPEALAAGIRSVINHQRSVNERGHTFCAENYSWRRQSKKMEEVYQNLVEKEAK
ncbi:Glycosyltransferase involved in cell wall bisynthesis [Halogranum rubrum]|uniref:Glycosyltransferase involved in cell wall bisynthesis n=1 Tax=Halogranum rubrum TaxID=553466 RepID=A0A1I4B9G0_9EURY|nr:glycosyltransferase family 4 protein [Halogranum rubrum]SFK65424.1 Glycosyltransferase involved in cell wall bisynthesis [Halogranum rubrum]